MTTVATTPRLGTPSHRAELGMLARQARHELVSLLRTPITLILSIGLPLLFFVLLSALVGNEVVDPASGVRLVQYLAPGMAAFGVVMATFSFLAVGLAEARANGVVKRQSGTPVPRWVLIGGRVGAAVVLGLTATALIVLAGVLFYGLVVPSRAVAPILVALLLASACFSALGLALALALPTMQLTLAVTNGIVIPLAFVSDMFMVGTRLLPALSTIGWLFPLRHLTALLSHALDPYATGSGFALDHLAVLALWGLLGAAVATAMFRRGTDRASAGGRPGARTGAGARAPRHGTDTVPRRAGSPSAAAMVLDQVRHAQAALWRDASAVFFAVAFPVVLVVVIPSVNGGGGQVLRGGQTLGVFYAGTMAVYGAAVTAYVNTPQSFAEDRDRGVLKRSGGTPLPASALLAGRVVGALSVALVTGVAIAVLAAVAYRPTWPPGLPAALVSLVVATLCFAVVGLAVTTFVRSAQAVVGVTLGTLLPLAFVSDIFVVGATLPAGLEWLSWFFPLRHATAAVTEALGPAASGLGLAWGHLAVLVAWAAVGAVVLAARFRWDAKESGHTARNSSR